MGLATSTSHHYNQCWDKRNNTCFWTLLLTLLSVCWRERLSHNALSEALAHCSSQWLDHFTVPPPCVLISPHHSHVLFWVCGFWQSLFSSRAGSLWHFLTPDARLSIEVSLQWISELSTHFVLLLKRPSNLIQFQLLSSIYLNSSSLIIPAQDSWKYGTTHLIKTHSLQVLLPHKAIEWRDRLPINIQYWGAGMQTLTRSY